LKSTVLSTFLYHGFHFHQACEAAALVFVQFHGNEVDGLLKPWDYHIFQRVRAAPGLLDFVGQQLEGFSTSARWIILRQEGDKALDCVVQLGGRFDKAVA